MQIYSDAYSTGETLHFQEFDRTCARIREASTFRAFPRGLNNAANHSIQKQFPIIQNRENVITVQCIFYPHSSFPPNLKVQTPDVSLMLHTMIQTSDHPTDPAHGNATHFITGVFLLPSKLLATVSQI
jgi:hypothetical protein